MSSVRLIVAYPRPTDIEAFEAVYRNEHIPMAAARLVGKTKMASTTVLRSPQGTPPFYRIAEVHFPSIQQSAASSGAQEALSNAVKISSGGPPVIMIAEEETSTFEGPRQACGHPKMEPG
jgi:uncharacterized protein (TIGR02118 family)